MNYEPLEAMRACPFRCGWESNRRIRPARWTTHSELVGAFIKRCHDDVAEHLEKDHGAKRYTSAENYLASPEGQCALRTAITELDAFESSAVAPPGHITAGAGGWEGREAAPGKPSEESA